jgi:phage protein D/phage baseplate assembly protein gpV
MTSMVTAAVEVRVDGQPLLDPDRVRSVRVASRLAQPSQCELVLAPGHGQPGWPAPWRFGTRLAVRVTGEPDELFTGEVTAIELAHGPDGSAEVRVRAYDLLHRLRKRQRPRVFEDVTVADVVAQLTADLDLTLLAPDAGPRLDRLVQHRQSDFELLLELTGRAGLYPVLRGRELRLVTLAGHGEPVTLRLGGSLWDLRVEANLDRVVRRVTALGWHSQRAEALAEPAAGPRGLPRRLDPDPGEVGVEGERFLVDRPVRGSAELAALAQADLDASAHRAVTVSGVADGDARLWAGRRVALAGVPAEVSDEHLLAEVVHTVGAAGYQSSFSTAVPPPPAAPVATGSALTLGRVTDVSDPEGLGRVRVELPAVGDLDAGWLAVLCPGAGPDRGLVALPDVGDTVLVGLPGQRPADGVVLGSLYGTVAPPDPGVVGGAVRRWSLRTAAGQSVVVDDAGGLVRVENQGGSFLELGPDRLRLHATTDLVIEAPGQGITVRARSVDFEQALI